MRNQLEKLATQALGLPEHERAELVAQLIASLPPALEMDLQLAELVTRRIEEIESGRVAAVPIEDAIERVRLAIR